MVIVVGFWESFLFWPGNRAATITVLTTAWIAVFIDAHDNAATGSPPDLLQEKGSWTGKCFKKHWFVGEEAERRATGGKLVTGYWVPGEGGQAGGVKLTLVGGKVVS
jgi:hypothetical protein